MSLHSNPCTFPRSRNVHSRRRQLGLSLIELMISVTIGLLLLAGLTTLIVQQSTARTELDKVTRQIENGRYAIQVLEEDLQMAGFYGEFSNQGSTAITTPALLPDPCTTVVANLKAALPLHVQGYDSPSTVPSPLNVSACLLDANHISGTDILVIRRADSTIYTSSTIGSTGQVYLQSTLSGAVMGADNTGTDWTTLKKKDGTTNGDLRKWLVHIYFVSPCNVMANGSTCASSDDNGSPMPTLKMLELSYASGAPAFKMTPLVEGIENLQIDYGIDTDNDGAPDSYSTGGTMTTADWANVMALRVNVLARNTEKTMGYSDTKSYVLGNTTIAAANDNYQRHAFSTLVRLGNPGGRREQ